MYCLTFYVLYQPFIIFKLTLYRQPGNLLFVSHCPLNAPREFTFPLNMMLFWSCCPLAVTSVFNKWIKTKNLGNVNKIYFKKGPASTCLLTN